jgi:predicted RNA-binding Zn ribbon-like protein
MLKESSAPGSLELVRDFVNSLDLDHPELDPFLTTETAAAWIVEHGGSGDPPHPREIEALRDLREALRTDLVGHATGIPESRTWPTVATLLGGTGLKIAMGPAGDMRLVALGGSAADALRGNLAAAIYDALRDGSWRRLKACRKHTCLYAFYDRSKNASGTWCNMAVCGNRAKAERRRARERSQGSD